MFRAAACNFAHGGQKRIHFCWPLGHGRCVGIKAFQQRTDRRPIQMADLHQPFQIDCALSALDLAVMLRRQTQLIGGCLLRKTCALSCVPDMPADDFIGYGHTRTTVLLQRQVLTHLDQVRSRLDDGTLSLRETYTTLRGERVRIIAVSDINSELANREVDSWIKLIRVLTHEIMNTITPITSLSQTLLCKATGELREGLETISRTGSELMAFVDNYRRFTHVPQPQPKLFYVKPFAERMARLAPCEVEVNVCPADLLVYADEGCLIC